MMLICSRSNICFGPLVNITYRHIFMAEFVTFAIGFAPFPNLLISKVTFLTHLQQSEFTTHTMELDTILLEVYINSIQNLSAIVDINV